MVSSMVNWAASSGFMGISWNPFDTKDAEDGEYHWYHVISDYIWGEYIDMDHGGPSIFPDFQSFSADNLDL